MNWEAWKLVNEKSSKYIKVQSNEFMDPQWAREYNNFSTTICRTQNLGVSIFVAKFLQFIIDECSVLTITSLKIAEWLNSLDLYYNYDGYQVVLIPWKFQSILQNFYAFRLDLMPKFLNQIDCVLGITFGHTLSRVYIFSSSLVWLLGTWPQISV